MNRREFAKLGLITPLGIQSLIHSPTEEQFGKYDFGLSAEQEQRAARLQGAYQSMAREYTGSRSAPAPPRARTDAAPTPSLIGFDDYRDFPNITRGLVKRGYSDEQIRGILGENFLRVFEAVCG